MSKMFDDQNGKDYDGYNFVYTANNALQLHENGSSRDARFTSITGVLSNGWALYTANIQFGNGGGKKNNIFVNGRNVLTFQSTESGITHRNANLIFPKGLAGEGRCDIGQFYYYNTELSQAQVIQNFDATKPTYGV
jgi:hypothetical protein